MLDEWSTGTPSTVKLESKQYAKTYKAILNGMEAVDQDEHHGPLLRQRLAAWAGFGQWVSFILFVEGIAHPLPLGPSVVRIAHQPTPRSPFVSTLAHPPDDFASTHHLKLIPLVQSLPRDFYSVS